MKPEPDNLNRIGSFTIGPDGKFLGSLRLDGQNTSLYLRSDKRFGLNLSLATKITGVLDDLTKVSLIGSWRPTAPSSVWSEEGSIDYCRLYPNYVVLDNHNVSSQDEIISSIRFVPEDWEILFRNLHPYRMFRSDKSVSEHLVQSEDQDRIGKHQAIFYSTGECEIFSCVTSIGQISAFHIPRTTYPTVRGFRTDSEVNVRIRFDQPVDFDSAILAVIKTQMFFDYIVGRVQNVSGLAITTGLEDDTPYDVHDCTAPRREQSSDGLRGDSGRPPFDVSKNPERFGSILSSWLSRDQDMLESRNNLLLGWKNRHSYDGDRVVRSANVFDLMPSGFFPSGERLPEDIQTAISNAKAEFGSLPDSIERNKILTVLGMAGKYSLANKVLHRAAIVTKEFSKEISEINIPCKEAVKCRNRYVHGTPSKIDFENHPELSMFLVDTLEFVFAASDLIDSGWSASDWHRPWTDFSHQFELYLYSYKDHLSKLKEVVCESS